MEEDRYLTFLATSSNLAPFFGLLGTVWGIMIAFFQIGHHGSADLTVVAPGIAMALITTVAGLVVAIPASVLSLTIPMFDLGGSVDYHPFTNDNVDTKLSLGLNLDGYRFIYHAGIGGLFTQAEASLKFNHFKLYAQAGYRFDIVNIAGSIKTASGTAPKDGEIKYVPAPYVKAGMGYRF